MAEGKKLIIIIGVAAATCLGMKYLLPYAAPFVIAALFVRLLNPLLFRIRKRICWKKEILAAILVIIISVLLGFFFYFLYETLMDEICRIASNFNQYYDGICRFMDDCCFAVEKRIGVKTGEIRTAVERSLVAMELQMQEKILPGVLNHSFQYLMKMIEAAGFLFLVFIGVVLLVKDYDQICEQLSRYRLFQGTRRIMGRIWHMGGAYLRSQLIIIGVVMLLCVGGLFLLGNPYALLLGIIIGLLDALPFLGTGTVLIPWAIVLLLQKKVGLAAGYAVLFLVTNTVREVLEPRLIGERIGVYPFAIAAVVYAGLYFFGIWGVLLGPVSLLLIMEICREIFAAEE